MKVCGSVCHAQLRLIVPGKMSERDKLIEHNALLLDQVFRWGRIYGVNISSNFTLEQTLPITAVN
ncbi:unnamed protein product [Dovyalis caffra]|uniref:Uncharacterized protein n=1 Tax=Dovyalis caffra TaxID=77055 RepID=A0AAV1RXX0_9ROSI|nr:unnamed protein product [Dovyalis caffra]